MKIPSRTIAILAVLMIVIPGQARSIGKSEVVRKLVAGKPSIYLEYVNISRSVESCTLKEQDSFRLRMHNNTSIPINVAAGYAATGPFVRFKDADGRTLMGLPKGAKVEMCYQVEIVTQFPSSVVGNSAKAEVAVDRPLPQLDYFCSCNYAMSKSRPNDYQGLWIPSGSYVDFDVPQKYLEKNLKLYTLFNYPWEFEKGELGYNESHHQVYIYYTDVGR